MKRALPAALALAFVACTPVPSPTERATGATGPFFNEGGWEAEALGQASLYPRVPSNRRLERKELVGTFSAYDELYPSRPIAAPAQASPLRRAPEPAIFYDSPSGRRDIDHYLANNPTTALLIAKGDTILVERYQYGRREATRFTSHSMAKTLTAMLFGIALAEGHIRSLDDTAETYVPELAGSEYGRTPLKALLSMSSGVAFREEYDGNDDVAKLARGTLLGLGPGGPTVLRQFDTRANPPDTRFYYASAETQVLGNVLVAATGRKMADYAAEKLWQKLGAEAGASWVIDRAGYESAFCCFQATLRDWARVGLMLANDGAWNGRQIVPRDWVIAATSVDPRRRHLAPGTATRYFGYGYQTWIFPGPTRTFALQGVFGQALYVDPANRLVMVHLAARASQRDPGGAQTTALWRGVRAALGN
ncbi:MAG: serine hydrolase [Proteobacteria bacterium]|nr:serine hydrolase [Pseudomonadota bacterium]